MAKLFISLFLMVLASFLLFIGFSIAVETVGSSVGATADIEERFSKGTLNLLDESIEGLSAEELDVQILRYQNVFGSEFALLKMSELEFDDEKKQKLEQQLERHEIVINEEVLNHGINPPTNTDQQENVDFIYRKNLDTNLVWRIHLDTDTDFTVDNLTTTLKVTGGRFVDGMFYVLDQKLSKIEKENLKNYVGSLEPSFGLKLKYLNNADLGQLFESTPDISEAEKIELRTQFNLKKVINTTQGSNHATFVRYLTDSTHAIQVGPVEIPWFIRNVLTLTLLTFVFSIATALFIWLWPLWSNLIKIRNAANEFGQGHYNARIPYRKRSAIAPVAQAFNAMAERTQHSINTQKELTTAVSHELRTPVARMRFALEMLEDCYNETDRARYQESLNGDLDDLDLLLEELLTYARFDQKDNKLDLRLEKVSKWLSTSMERLMPLADKKLLNYQIEGIGINESAYFEPRLMTRALDNLVQNALRYAENTVEVTLKKDTKEYVLIVEDDGIGISKSDQAHIFEAFSRIDSSRNRSTGGFGLGLAITNRIVKAHKGSIKVGTSKLGGAHFEVRWPLGAV